MHFRDILKPTPSFEPNRLFAPRDVGGESAWHHLVHRGALQPWYGGYAVPTTATPNPALRATAIARATVAIASDKNPIVVAGLSAFWLHYGGQLPQQIQLIHGYGRKRPTNPEIVSRATAIAQHQVTRIGSIWVTTPERTIADIALWYPEGIAVTRILELVDHGANLRAASIGMERRIRALGRTHARKVIEAVAATLATRVRNG